MDAQERRHIDIIRGRRLEYLTIGWNVIEALVAVISGIGAGSAALIGFGLDSAIESTSGAVLLWRLKTDELVEEREQRALKLVAISFWALAAYVAFDSGKSLILKEPPDVSIAGMVIAVLSLIVMPVLARAKRKAAASIKSRALVADSRQTDICAYLSLILLLGLSLNAACGWWWADSAAGMVMAPIIGKEGLEAWKGEKCECQSCS